MIPTGPILKMILLQTPLKQRNSPFQIFPLFGSSMTSPKKRLDPVVLIGIGVLLGSFFLIGMGMYLSRPDRTIPPYSIGSQVGTTVAVHTPSYTSDPELQALLHRFRKVGRESRDFGSLKIRPTTPELGNARYQRMTIYVFANPEWTTLEMLEQYLARDSQRAPEGLAWIEEFEKAVRGGYVINEQGQRGWIGSLKKVEADDSFGHLRVQELFHDSFSIQKGNDSPMEK